MKKTKWIIGIGILFFLFVTGAIISAIAVSDESGGTSRMSSLIKQDGIGIVELEGVIYSSDRLVKEISSFEKDKSVKALVIRINSPGGAVAPSQEVYEAIMKFRSTTQRPVIASLGSVAASGGYYIASAADTIMANQGTLTGSIGVIFEFPRAQELMKKIGVDFEVIKSGKYKDAGAIHRQLTSDERKLFQGVIDDTWEQFVEAVAIGRNMDFDTVAKFADGRVMTGRQAHAIGLVDLIGTYEDAKSLAKEITSLPSDAPEKTVATPSSFFEKLMKQPKELLNYKDQLIFGRLSYLFMP